MDGPERPAFGELLRRFRLERRYSGRALARLAGLDSTYVGRLERGLQNPPKVPTVHRLAVALQLGPRDEAILIEASGRLPEGMEVVPRSGDEGEGGGESAGAATARPDAAWMRRDQNRLGEAELRILQLLEPDGERAGPPDRHEGWDEV